MPHEKYIEDAIRTIGRWTHSDWWMLMYVFNSYEIRRKEKLAGVRGTVFASPSVDRVRDSQCFTMVSARDNERILLFMSADKDDLATCEYDEVLLIGSECTCNCGNVYLIAISRTDEIFVRLNHKMYTALTACGVHKATAAILAAEDVE